MSDQPEIYNNSSYLVQEYDNGLRLSEGMKIFMFFLIVVSNLVFICYWVAKMMREVKVVMLKKFANVYLFLFLCGSVEKLAEK